MPGEDEASISQAILDSYNLEAGAWPANYDEVMLLLNVHKEIETSALYELGLLPASDYKEILGSVLKNKSTDDIESLAEANLKQFDAFL